jgi:AcrR family transcriptional regulator
MVVDDANLSRRERKKLETKIAILEAARDLFQDRGFDETSIEAIAERADVSRSTFFNYFPTKESLLSEIAAVEMESLERLVIVKLAEVPSAVDKIRHVMRLLIADTVPFLRVTRHVLLETMLHPSDVPSPLVQLDAILAELVGQAQAQGEIRADLAPSHVAQFITGAYLAAFFSWIADDTAPTKQPAPEGTEITVFVDMLFAGIAGPLYEKGEG